MKAAPVTQLKASLSRYLAGVKSGEEVVITERGRPVAKIIPIAEPQDHEEQRLRKMESQGLLRMGSGKLPKDFWDAPRPADRAGAVRKTLLEERREGR